MKSKSPKPPASDAANIPWPKLHEEAKKRFGIHHFRPGQREVLEAVFTGRSALALMPTGAGKSLCYQLPALFLPKTVLVVSPLIALMSDQREKAQEAEIAVEKFDSTLNTAEASEVEQAIEAGLPQLLYVTPERLEHPEFIGMLAERGVSLLAVDEAHCISQWGHDFRPAYLHLGEARKRLGNPPVLALTATASEDVATDLLKQLHAEDAVVVNTGIERGNLLFSVVHTVNTLAKQNALMKMIAAETGTGIVYTASIRTATELYEWLAENEIAAGLYHGRLRAKEREETQAKFMRGDYKVLVATKAFGMGIDKPDIRFVYHYEFPDSLETYYQEAGRAGRDGKPARTALLYRLEDKRIQSFFLAGRYPRIDEVRRVYSALAAPVAAGELVSRTSLSKRKVQVILHMLMEGRLAARTKKGYVQRTPAPAASRGAKDPGAQAPPVSTEGTEAAAGNLSGESDQRLVELLAAYESRGRTDSERLSEMMHYAESPVCRKQLLRAYFGEEPGAPCGTCDNCAEPIGERLAQHARAAQEEVTRVEMAIGSIETTAPETIPRPGAIEFVKGDSVQHRRFGKGKVLDSDGQNLVARFEKAGTKKVRHEFVRRIA